MKRIKSTVKHSRGYLFHVEAGGATYFVTFAARRGEYFARHEREVIMAACGFGDPAQWILHGVVVMPDHVHMLMAPVFVNKKSAAEGEETGWISVAEIVKGIKSVAARKINRLRGRKSGSVWLDEYYDRIVRDEEDFVVKIEYMKNNPVKRRLVSEPGDWDTLLISRPAEERCERWLRKK